MTLSRLKELEASATEGPWIKDDDTRANMERHCDVAYRTETGLINTIAFMAVDSADHEYAHANAALIVAMRNNFRALIEVAEIAGEFVAKWDHAGDYTGPLHNQLRAALSRLDSTEVKE